MGKQRYEMFGFEEQDRQQSFLRKKISLTIPICVLLIVVFLLSALLVTIVAFYWIDGTICHVESSTGIIQPKRVHHSRPKRSSTLEKANARCLAPLCCSAQQSPPTPWTDTRLPTNIYPIEYQLTLYLYELNEDNDQYNGTVDIVIEVRSPTYEIILHNDIQVTITDIIVSRRSNPNDTMLNVDCGIPSQNTQTLRIYMKEELQVGYTYDVRIFFHRNLHVHGTGIFESQFNKYQDRVEFVMSTTNYPSF